MMWQLLSCGTVFMSIASNDARAVLNNFETHKSYRFNVWLASLILSNKQHFYHKPAHKTLAYANGILSTVHWIQICSLWWGSMEPLLPAVSSLAQEVITKSMNALRENKLCASTGSLHSIDGRFCQDRGLHVHGTIYCLQRLNSILFMCYRSKKDFCHCSAFI